MYSEIQENKLTMKKVIQNIPNIYKNIMNLLPKIDEKMFDNYTEKEIINWIDGTYQILEQIVYHYKNKSIILKEQTIRWNQCYQKNKNKLLDMEKLERLPDDILRHIYEFTGPDIRLKLFEGRYPDISILLKPLTMPILKRIHKWLYYCYHIGSKTQPRKKEKMIELIKIYVKSYKNSRIENHEYYQKKCIDLYLNILIAYKLFKKT